MRNQSLAVLLLSLFITIPALNADLAKADTPQVKDWTFLTYLNGDNSLDSFGAININQMETVGSTDQINVVVQWASTAAGKTQRLYVKKDNDTSTVTSPIVQDMGKVDMGDYHTLIDFIRWGVQNYPAKHYFINVWDHGSGWHQLNMLGNGGHLFHPSDISWDEGSGNFITTAQLGEALNEAAKIIGHKVDLYGSDACLMAMAEVADEMANSVETFVGSQEVEPGAGWPYDKLMSRWSALPAATSQDVAKILVEEYVNLYANGPSPQEATFSAFDLSKISALNSAVTAFGTKLRTLDKDGRTKLMTVARSTQSFTYSDYADLGDFLTQLNKAGLSRSFANEASDLGAALKDFVIESHTTAQYARATGMSIWLPTGKSALNMFGDKYKTLHFQADTGWQDTLTYLLQDDNGTRH